MRKRSDLKNNRTLIKTKWCAGARSLAAKHILGRRTRMISIWPVLHVRLRFASSVETFGMERSLVRRLCLNSFLVGCRKTRVTSPSAPCAAHALRKTEVAIIWRAPCVNTSSAGPVGRVLLVKIIILVLWEAVVYVWWMIQWKLDAMLPILMEMKKRESVIA